MPFVFMLVLLEPSGFIVKPEPVATVAECDARIVAELAKGKVNGYAICIPAGAALEIGRFPSADKAGS